ncbi:MAG: transmembrane protein 254 [Microthrixaceae bacterium]|nr:DUF4499 domain-containing protein [Microthrixaceae bacterium]MCO5316800.1 transmembrane protein 254 [Microthrixaceae bacterium]
MARRSDKPVTPRPGILWRLCVMGGLGTMIAVSVDDNAWEAFDDATGGTVDRDTIRAATGATVGLHVLEALISWIIARRAGLDRPRRWALSTLLWGFPVHRRLRKARRMELAA